MGLQSLADWLIQNPGFQEHLNRLTARAVATNMGAALKPTEAIAKTALDWRYLMHCATILAASDSPQAQDAALRIAQFALVADDATTSAKIGSAMVLEALANVPAVKLAIKKELLPSDFAAMLPMPMQIDLVRHSLQNAIVRNDAGEFSANNFQRAVWDAANENQWISVSAPTSAGKSFILIEWMGEKIRENPQSLIVYIVPTRALISQVAADLREFVIREDMSDGVNISSFPDGKEVNKSIANIFVFTQERLHLFLLSVGHAKSFSAVVIDEAHKVGDRYRGILLQQMIEWIASQSPGATFIFSSPFSSNPEYLLSEAPQESRKRSFVSEISTVNQNLLWVSQVSGKPKCWNVHLWRKQQLENIGQIELPFKPGNNRRRLAFVASAIAAGQPGNIVYVNGADEAEKVAEAIYQISSDSPQNEDISSLIDICRKSVHSDFLLSKFLKRGIAFHYGNIPQIVRLEVERLFKTDAIHTLVCTSTLIEGVNMSCRNIFIRGPQKGRGNPMPDEDFWNLAGRAGRWGTEFQGNIFCIDPLDENAWGEGKAPKARAPYAMKRTTDKILTYPDAFIRYVRDGAPPLAAKDRELEYLFSYLSGIHLREGSIKAARWAARFPPDRIDLVSDAIGDAVKSAAMPLEVIEKNPGISPLAMRSLLDYFILHADELENFLPADPDSDDAVENYQRLFTVISAQLLAPSLGGNEQRVRAVSILVHQWMKGLPIPVIINKRRKNLKSRGKMEEMPTTIRKILEEVESVARFYAPKYVACYNDILRMAMTLSGKSHLADEIVELGTYLEFGASQQTQLSLMALGFSRTAAIEISNELIAQDNLTEEEALAFLRRGEWESDQLSELVTREIGELLKARA